MTTRKMNGHEYYRNPLYTFEAMLDRGWGVLITLNGKTQLAIKPPKQRQSMPGAK